MSQLASSSDLEVQERASVLLAFLKFVSKHLDKGESLSTELSIFFDGELNPVAPKAQKKVPGPEGLDLDAWINEPPSESGQINLLISISWSTVKPLFSPKFKS